MELALSARLVLVVVFVPVPDLWEHMTALEEHLPLLDWFKDICTCHLARGGSGRRAPLWNVFTRTCTPKTVPTTTKKLLSATCTPSWERAPNPLGPTRRTRADTAVMSSLGQATVLWQVTGSRCGKSPIANLRPIAHSYQLGY